MAQAASGPRHGPICSPCEPVVGARPTTDPLPCLLLSPPLPLHSSRASDCASSAGCWTHCHDKLRVCVPRDPAPDGCPGTLRMGAASAATAAAVAAAAAQLPEVPASSPDPLSGEGEVAMAVAEAGRECSWDNPCPRGRCESDYLQERYVCVDP